ncbi:FMN reductase (NADPH) [Nocardia farcinica]|uniref:FMN reductase n=1 Tax=Nocardia farcinica TaxID=37329 RepID=UPI000BF724CB|nr:FMN reductase [Nocardia farcinica]MBF6067816.1 FMN reductase [Nocardia farcinica]PFX05032.1 FMN reductase (NADPH) [Nocardia farcinica]PFX09378.1 FMN reductase (NADPH) [Nocardia farcinica]
MTDTRIAVISAGLSQPSSTRLLADRLAAATARSLTERAREAEVAGPGFTDAEFTGAGSSGAEFNGAEFTVIELRDHAHDLANNLVTGFPSPALREVTEAVTTASGLIAVTPIFNASYSGLFKTFFDVLEPDSLTGMPVLLGATGGTERHSLALEHALRPMFAYLRSIVVPTAVYAASADWGGGDAGEGLDRRIDRAAGELAELVAGRVGARSADPDPADPYEETVPFEDLLAGRLG